MVVKKGDIAIMGGGVQGLLLAYYAKVFYPRRTVSLFESRIIGGGITAYSAHLHAPFGRGAKYDLTVQSLDLFSKLLEEYWDLPLLKVEIKGICRRENLSSILCTLVEKSPNINSYTYPFNELSEEYICISGLAGYVSKRNLTGSLMEIVASLGVKIHEGTAIVSAKKDGNGYKLLSNTGQVYSASYIFNATGKDVIRSLLQAGTIVETKKVVALHVDKPTLPDAPVYMYFDHDAFLLPQPYYSRYLLSCFSNEWNVEDNPALQINNSDLELGKRILNIYTKDFSEQISGGQVFLDVYNRHSGAPLIHEVEKNHFIIGATGGSGVRLAPALAVNALKKLSL